jgi:hypothetical protein
MRWAASRAGSADTSEWTEAAVDRIDLICPPNLSYAEPRTAGLSLSRSAQRSSILARIRESRSFAEAVGIPARSSIEISRCWARNRIAQRTKDALAAAKTRGQRLGNPDIGKARKVEAEEHAQHLRLIIKPARGLPAKRISAILNDRKVTTWWRVEGHSSYPIVDPS